MSPPPVLGPEERLSNVSVAAASFSMDCLPENATVLKERNYLGFSDCSSVDSSTVPSLSEENKNNMNLKATELRLGLPGAQSPGGEAEFCLLSCRTLDEKPLFPLLPSKDGISSSSQKNVVSGNKRGFCDTMDPSSDMKSPAIAKGDWIFHATVADSDSLKPACQGKFSANSGINKMVPSRPSGPKSAIVKELAPSGLQEFPRVANGADLSHKDNSSNHNSSPAAKAQVVGWPPIKSFRKNSLASTSKNNEEVDGKPASGALFVKVSMDGAPYLRKVDLRNYSTYGELSSALEKMFSCFTIGQCGSHGAPGPEILSESKLRDILHGSEYVLTYEDKDGDWMLVGDVPWEMFIDSCRRLKIMKGSDAIGLAPRATEKSINKI